MVFASVLVSLTPVVGASEPAARFPAAQPAPLAARVAMLEGRVHRLELRLRQLEKAAPGRRADGSYQFDANGARVVVSPQGAVTTTRTPPGASKARQPRPDCDPPYKIDARGIRTIKVECLEVSECDPPYTVDASGIRRPKANCP